MKISFIVVVLSVIWCTIPAYHSPKWYIREPIDLTWTVDEQSVFWPGVRPFFYTRKVAQFDEDNQWYAMNEFCTGEHGGTHLDAPYHFHKFGWRVADIPIQKLLAHAVVIDMSEIVSRLGSDTELQEADLMDWERIYGPLPHHCVLLVRFGWSDYYPKRNQYFGLNGTEMVFPVLRMTIWLSKYVFGVFQDQCGSDCKDSVVVLLTLYYIGISADAARWIAKTKKVVGVGVDTASVDSGTSTKFEAHRVLAENGIYNLENLNIPKRLPARGFNVIVMPMKLRDGSGAPARVLAIPEITLSNDKPCQTMDFSVSSVPWYGHTSVVLSSLLLLGMYAINCFTL